MSWVAEDTGPINLPFRSRTRLRTAADALAKLIFEPLEPYDTTDSCIKATVEVPDDDRISQNWGLFNALLYKLITGISRNKLIRNVNIYYYGQTIGLKPGAVLFLSAHRVKEDWLEANISVEGSLIATAIALSSDQPATGCHDRPLGSPIVFSKQFRALSEEDSEISPKCNKIKGFQI